jgi:predicted metalloprotease
MNNILEDGDLDEALSAAHAVAMMLFNLRCRDMCANHFTHGTSEQRKYWFMKEAIKRVTSNKEILLTK